MKTAFHVIASGALAACALAAPLAAQEQHAEASAAYSVNTTLVGTLLDDPQAAAIIEEMLPTVYANDMFQTMGRSQTLKGIQQYEPGVITEEVLAKIQAAFDELAASRH